MNAEEGQVSLFGHDGCAGKTFQAHSAQGHPKGKTFVSSWKKSFELKAIPFMSLDLTPGHGNLLGESYWEMISPLLGGSSILNTGPAPLNEENVSILSQILEEQPHPKYYLSRTACLGILRRAKERGKELPPQLKAALMAQAGIPLPAVSLDNSMAAMEQDCLTPWDTQQARIFTPESKAPTLTGADGGGGRNPAGLLFTTVFCLNDQGGQRMDLTTDITSTLRAQMGGHQPLICLNDQGGSVMECSEEVSGTLRAQEHGHQPLVFENHGPDSRYKGPLQVAPTVVTAYGSGGNNVPLVGMELFSRQRVDVFKKDHVASTESARQHKDATDLICQTTYQETVGTLTSSDHKGPNSQYVGQDKLVVEGPLLIRRLTPRECERLQGYPDDFTNIPDASDSARYRALGNSVSIPCVEYIMKGLAMAEKKQA